MIKLLSIFFFISWICTPIHAQSKRLNFQDFSIKDGFSHNNIKDVLVGQQGFIWIATPNGLNRFDGQEFKLYTKKDYGLFSNNISSIVEVDSQFLWIRYNGSFYNNQTGVNGSIIERFNKETGHCQPIENELPKELYAYLLEAKNYTITQATPNHIFFSLGSTALKIVYNTKDKSFNVFKHIETIEQSNLYTFETSSHYWITSYKASQPDQNSISYYNPEGQLIEKDILSLKGGHCSIKQGSMALQKTFILYSDFEKSTLYIKTIGQPIAKIPLGNYHFEVFQYNPYTKEFWGLSKYKELIIYNQKGQIKNQFQVSPNYFNKRKLRYTIFDSHGGFWLHTYGHLFYLSQSHKQFQLYHHFQSKDAIKGNIKSMSLVQDSLLFFKVSAYGTFIDNLRNSTSAVIWPDSMYNFNFISNTSTLSKNNTHIWLDVKDNQKIEKRSIDQQQQESYLAPFFNRITGRYYIESTQLHVFAHDKGLGILNEKTKELTPLTFPPPYDNMSDVHYKTFCAAPKGVWVLGEEGLLLLDNHCHISMLYNSTQPKESGRYLPPFSYSHISQDKHNPNCYWLSTFGDGFLEWYPQSGVYHQYTTKDGLSDNNLYSIYEDDYNCLWMGSDIGINRFDKKNKLFQNFLLENGISHLEFNTNAHCKSSDGRLYFGSMNGITAFHPKDFIEKDSNSAALVITEFTRFNTEKNIYIDETYQVIKNQQIELPIDNRNSILKFALLDYNYPKSHRYAYQIEGLETNWQYTKTPQINLGGINYGNYQLKIKAMGSNRVWTKEKIISISVPKPFYIRWWAILLYVFSLVGTISKIVAWRINSIQKRKKELELEVVRRTIKIQNQAKKLKKLDELKSKFFANISHELRTPLTLILGPLSFIIDDPDKITPSIYKELHVMQRNGKRLLHLIEEILDLSKIEANKLEINERPNNLYLVLKDIYANFEAQAQIQSLDFKFIFEGDKEHAVLLDKKKVEKVVFNLLSNAFKFTLPNGAITLKASSADQDIIIEVIDTGKGISSQDLPYIFNRFYQTAETGTKAEGGTGIGLALCKEFVELMNGTINVQSKLNQGSHFKFSIPYKLAPTMYHQVIEPSYQVEEPIIESPIHQPSKSKNTILLVEDNTDLQEFIQRLLQSEFNISIANNGQEAITKLNEVSTPPDLILSDIMMPLMNGFQFLDYLKSSASYQRIPTIMLTARSSEQDKLHALTIGVDDYLIKPFSIKELQARINNLIKNANLRKEFIAETTTEEVTQQVTETTKQKESQSLSKNDVIWLKELEMILREEATVPEFKTPTLAKSMNVSESTLKRKLKKLIGVSPGQYIKEIRLQLAREHLERGDFHTLNEVCFAVGFVTPHHFSKEFEKRFGKKVIAYF